MTTNPQITVELSRERLAGSFPDRLGIEFVEISDETVRARMVADERHLHPGGFVHGGVWATLADTTAAWGTIRHLEPGHGFTTVEMKINVFASAVAGDELVAEAEPLHVGRRTQVWEVRIRNGERPAASFVCTQMVLPGENDPRTAREA